MRPSCASLIKTGNFDDDLAKIAEADWIIEAIVENLEIKRSLFSRVDAVRRPGSIVSSNTSGISINAMAEGRSDDFRRHFLGTHFFNPPRYLKLLETIPTSDTDREVVGFVADYCDRRLREGNRLCEGHAQLHSKSDCDIQRVKRDEGDDRGRLHD